MLSGFNSFCFRSISRECVLIVRTLNRIRRKFVNKFFLGFSLGIRLFLMSPSEWLGGHKAMIYLQHDLAHEPSSNIFEKKNQKYFRESKSIHKNIRKISHTIATCRPTALEPTMLFDSPATGYLFIYVANDSIHLTICFEYELVSNDEWFRAG